MQPLYVLDSSASDEWVLVPGSDDVWVLGFESAAGACLSIGLLADLIGTLLSMNKLDTMLESETADIDLVTANIVATEVVPSPVISLTVPELTLSAKVCEDE